jgi:hypothetical protein
VRVSVKVPKNTAESALANLQRRLPVESQKAALKAAQAVSNNIKRNASKGVGLNRSAFKPYTPAYAKLRQKKGRSISPVDLNFTGQMFASMNASKFNATTARVAFSGLAQARKAFFNNQRRPFFGIDRNYRDTIGRVFRRHFQSIDLT